MPTHLFQRGFSLLELGIVIVVIGLIAGGVLIGQGMIRSAEVQSILSDFSKYQAATARFQSQFASIPGDMPDATSHWADAANGNGNGFVDQPVFIGPGITEPHQFWLHLSRAGEIDISMSGSRGLGTAKTQSGVNAPGSKITSSAWMPGYDASATFGGILPAVASSNYFSFTADSSSGGVAILTPAEALQIDTKVDNGLPAEGDVVTLPVADCIDANGYRAFDENRLCGLVFLNAY